MNAIYPESNIKYVKVSGTLNKNWQAKSDSGSQFQIPTLAGTYNLREFREKELKESFPFSKCNIIIRIIDITFIPVLR